MRAIIDFPRDRQPRLSGVFQNPREVLVARDLSEVMPLLQKIDTCAKQGRWAVGMLAYEAAAAFDDAFPHPPAPSDLPLAAFAVYDEISEIKKNAGGTFTCSPWQNNTTRAEFLRTIDIIREDIAAGRYYQTNFTTRLLSDFTGDAEAFFYALCEAQPGGYSFYLDGGEWQIASVSPELFFAWNPATGELTTRPMKGTSSLSHSSADLQKSEKDRAENLMIVDLLRNDMSRIANKVCVSELFAVQTLPTVRQMTSTITGVTRPNIALADVFAALFPCGSVTGAPKIAAMQSIAAHEKLPRGAYCGALGIVQPSGEALFSVGIRSVTIAAGKAICGIGSGITWDLKPAEEYAEDQIKQRFLWRASAGFDLLETMRLENGDFWLLQRHLDRLQKSAEYFGFMLDTQIVKNALNALTKQNPSNVFRVRLLVDRRGNVKTEIHSFGKENNETNSSQDRTSPPPVFTGGVRGGLANTGTNQPSLDPSRKNGREALVALAIQPINSADEFLSHKTTNRTVYETHAPKNPDIFDTLLFNERNEITEFTRGNVAVELDGKLVTPPESCGLLPGTLRAEMLATGKLTERIISCDNLRSAAKILFLNGLRGIIPAKL